MVNDFNVMALNSCRLNFYLPTAPKGRKIDFTFRAIQRENNVDYPLGDYTIDAGALIDAFKNDNVSRHELKSNFSDDYVLEFEIYVDNNRVTLEKNIRSYKQDRAIKSPLRNRKEETTVSGRKDFTQEKVEEKPQRDNEPEAEQDNSAPAEEETPVSQKETVAPKKPAYVPQASR